MNKLTRRAALIAAASLATYPLWKYLSPPSVRAQSIEVPFSELPENGVYMIRDRKLAIIRKKNEIRAISIACTHLGCTLNVADDIFICPCHGSKFTLEGKVLMGPATIDLKELNCQLTDKTVILYV